MTRWRAILVGGVAAAALGWGLSLGSPAAAVAGVTQAPADQVAEWLMPRLAAWLGLTSLPSPYDRYRPSR
jgi:hypothetical protein